MININKYLLFTLTSLIFLSCSVKVGYKTADGTQGTWTSNKYDNTHIKNDESVKINKLSNGLTYYIKNNQYPEDRLELLLVVNTGSIMEDDDQQGLAHFAEHMAFNGTEKYPKLELVDYLESIGMKFGPDLNAYTSFDETVYMLQVPVDDAEVVEKAFEILSEWAFNITFDNEEIDKERGVILEERRLRRDANDRLLEKTLPVTFKDSKYAERLPIGKKETIESFHYDVIKRFYKDWYRPDLMAVIAVGDLDENIIENNIKKYFSNTKSNKNVRERIEFEVPSFDEYRIAIASDPELSFPNVSITYMYDNENDNNSIDEYKNKLIIAMIREMFSVRLEDLTKVEDPHFMYSSCYIGDSWARPKDTFTIFGYTKEDKIDVGFVTLVEEVNRLSQYGFIPSELMRAKSKIDNDLQNIFNEKDKTESKKYKFIYRDHYLENKQFPSIDDRVRLFEELSPSITIEDINELTFELLENKNIILEFNYPDKENLQTLNEDDVATLYDNNFKASVKPYTEEVISEELFNKEVKLGNVREVKFNESLDIKELILSNNMKVIYKKTDFKNDEILFYGYSPGGHSLIDDDNYISAVEATDIVSSSGLGPFNQKTFEKFLADKSVSVSPFINELFEGFSGKSNIKDLELAFQMINLYFTEPRKDENAFNSYIERMRGFLENKDLSPDRVFFDSVKTIINSNHLRSKSLNINDLDKISLDKALDIYNNRFNNPGDFTFIFVGNIEEEQFHNYLNKYLASIENIDKTESWLDVGKKFPDGIKNENIYKGIDPKSFVYLTFEGIDEWSQKHVHDLDIFRSAFKIKLREVLREDMGGTYGVWMPGKTYQYPKEKYQFKIIFGCDPERVDVLTEALFSQIDSIKTYGLKEDYLNKAKEIERNDFKRKIKENDYWLDGLKFMYQNAIEENTWLDSISFNNLIDSVGDDDIKSLANKYLNTQNYVKAVLYPEK